ncbi:hypothetical protein NC651_025978 [Populus alba x Populus x berolinensis]|nr:hypothetical protein NC651_024889 [Populus alba x Populus x berolinensis]KAJ6892929.1 hypothetical protein NC651_025978 [Populus alba x Populus x berolinensis]
MAVETEVAAIPELALADSDINRASLVPLSSNVRVAASSRCQRLHDLSILVSFLQGLLHPTAVVRTRMQAADSGLSHMLRNEGIPGLSRRFGTYAIGAFPGEVLSLTAFEVSKDMMLTYTEVLFKFPRSFTMYQRLIVPGLPGALHLIAGRPFDVMVQGLPGSVVYLEFHSIQSYSGKELFMYGLDSGIVSVVSFSLNI